MAIQDEKYVASQQSTGPFREMARKLEASPAFILRVNAIHQPLLSMRDFHRCNCGNPILNLSSGLQISPSLKKKPSDVFATLYDGAAAAATTEEKAMIDYKDMVERMEESHNRENTRVLRRNRSDSSLNNLGERADYTVNEARRKYQSGDICDICYRKAEVESSTPFLIPRAGNTKSSATTVQLSSKSFDECDLARDSSDIDLALTGKSTVSSKSHDGCDDCEMIVVGPSRPPLYVKKSSQFEKTSNRLLTSGACSSTHRPIPILKSKSSGSLDSAGLVAGVPSDEFNLDITYKELLDIGVDGDGDSDDDHKEVNRTATATTEKEEEKPKTKDYGLSDGIKLDVMSDDSEDLCLLTEVQIHSLETQASQGSQGSKTSEEDVRLDKCVRTAQITSIQVLERLRPSAIPLSSPERPLLYLSSSGSSSSEDGKEQEEQYDKRPYLQGIGTIEMLTPKSLTERVAAHAREHSILGEDTDESLLVVPTASSTLDQQQGGAGAGSVSGISVVVELVDSLMSAPSDEMASIYREYRSPRGLGSLSSSLKSHNTTDAIISPNTGSAELEAALGAYTVTVNVNNVGSFAPEMEGKITRDGDGCPASQAATALSGEEIRKQKKSGGVKVDNVIEDSLSFGSQISTTPVKHLKLVMDDDDEEEENDDCSFLSALTVGTTTTLETAKRSRQLPPEDWIETAMSCITFGGAEPSLVNFHRKVYEAGVDAASLLSVVPPRQYQASTTTSTNR